MTNPLHGKNGSDTLPAAETGEAATGVPWSARAHADSVHSWERRYLWPLEGLRTALNHIQGDHDAEADPGAKAAIGLRWLRPIFIQYLSALHVAVEGYHALGLHDPAVEAVLPDLEAELRPLHAAVNQFVPPEQFRTALSGFYRPRGSTVDRRFSQTSSWRPRWRIWRSTPASRRATTPSPTTAPRQGRPARTAVPSESPRRPRPVRGGCGRALPSAASGSP